MNNTNETYYEDWLSDHKETLESEFIEEKEDEFAEFCKDRFNSEDYEN